MTKRLAMLALASLLLACEAETTPTPVATPSGTTPTGTPSAPIVSTPVPVARVQVSVQIQTTDKQVIPGAEVSISGSSDPAAKQVADASGRVTFKDLRKDSEYTIDVLAAGYEGATRKARLSSLLATQGQVDSLLLAIELSPLKSSIKGRAIDNNGAAIAGATVFDTRQNVTTDAQGRFTLGYSSANAGEVRLAISKSGFQSLSRTITIVPEQHQDLGDLTLTRRTGPQALGIDTSHMSLGQSNPLSTYAGLQSTISAQGFQVQTLTGNLEDRLDNLDALLILSPATSFSASEIAAIQAFVLSGRKLIVTGEWAGYSGFNGQAANRLLSPFQLQFGLDTLRENNSGFLSVKSFQGHALTSALSELRLYQAGSVLVGSNGDQLAYTGSGSFRIAANTGAFAVVAASSFGSGKVVVLGDTSFWSNEDSDGNGIANFNEADNRKLLEQILNW